jgi:hypothetical protein
LWNQLVFKGRRKLDRRRQEREAEEFTAHSVIRQIVEHLNLWEKEPSRDPPNLEVSTDNGKIIYEPFDDGWIQPLDAVSV